MGVDVPDGVTVAITNVSIIDVENGDVLDGRTIIISGENIVAIVESGEFSPPEGASVIDGAGTFAIPGLWDMHVHLANDEPPVDWDLDEPDGPDQGARDTYAPAWLAFGVTGLREMSGGKWSLKMRERIETHEIDGPHYIVGSPILDGAYPIWPGNGIRAVADATQARALVEEFNEQGFDFLKPYALLAPDTYRALLDEAGKAGMEVAGELPLSVSAWEAIDLGQRSIEHLTGIELACSKREAELRGEYAARIASYSEDAPQNEKVILWNRGEWEPIASFDPEKCRKLYDRMRENEVWVTPTLVIQQRISHPEDSNAANGSFLRYITEYDADVNQLIEEFDPARKLQVTYDHRFRSIDALNKARVGILAGSDMQGGFWLHHELKLFVDAGMTPLEALQTATLNPAVFLGRQSELGSIAPGKIADIVLLDENPLEAIEHTRDIHAIVLKGRIYDRRELDRMLAQIEADARAWEASD